MNPFDPFVAIDFETADSFRDSACAVALVRVEKGAIVARAHRLIRPPRSAFQFSYLHGIEWKHVKDQPAFREVWLDLAPILEGAGFLAAHNAPFDRSVLEKCCAAARLPPPRHRFECTVRLARQKWGIYPTKLPNVCEALDIPLKHHEALSDAEACARIVIAAAATAATEHSSDSKSRRGPKPG